MLGMLVSVSSLSAQTWPERMGLQLGVNWTWLEFLDRIYVG